MKNIKIAFFDIDGTMIDMNRKEISEKMLETLRRLKENNILICMATGRTTTCLPNIPGIEFDAFLTFNGSYCFNKQESIYGHCIPKADVEQILANAKKMRRAVSIATIDRLAANGRDDDLAEYYRFAKLELEVSEDFEETAKEDIYQIMLSCRKEEYAQIMDGVQHAKIAAWWDRAVDIIPSEGGKGKGIEEVLKYYHLKQEEAIAFGDGNNDIEMLQTVGLGVAMANASDDLKNIANDVCGHVAEDGIYYYCLQHGLI
ncbi:MAG: Cof-type HAD-IIB family hydrolase [Lachnospiraceae bacterium]|nr:Cof-type HAD-IIB family hydrolase [Lachnospiraceae bacterium]